MGKMPNVYVLKHAITGAYLKPKELNWIQGVDNADTKLYFTTFQEEAAKFSYEGAILEIRRLSKIFGAIENCLSVNMYTNKVERLRTYLTIESY